MSYIVVSGSDRSGPLQNRFNILSLEIITFTLTMQITLKESDLKFF